MATEGATAREPDQNDHASARMPIVAWRRYRALPQAGLCAIWTAVRAPAAGPTRLSFDVSGPLLSTTAPADRDRGVSDLRATRGIDSLRRLPTRCFRRKTSAQWRRSARFTSAGAPKMAGILSIAIASQQRTAVTFTHSVGAPLARRGGPVFSRSEARLPAESRQLGSLASRRPSS